MRRSSCGGGGGGHCESFFLVSNPTRWSLSFILGPLHWSSVSSVFPTSREHRNIVQWCTNIYPNSLFPDTLKVKQNGVLPSLSNESHYPSPHVPPSLTAETIGAGAVCFLYLLRSTESWSGVGKVWASWECSINQIMYLGNILLLYIVPLSIIRISTSFCTWGLFFFVI